MDTRTKVLAATGAAAVATAMVVQSGALKTPRAALDAPSAADAARFLTQASWGPTDALIAEVQALGFEGWIDQQMTPDPNAYSTLAYMNSRNSNLERGLEQHQVFLESFWTRVATGSDQLRQRMQFALSQIFVISRTTERLEYDGIFGTGNFYDVLANNAFLNYRKLIEDVTMNPMMGIFLSYVINDKEDPATGRNPDENYAREIMQLMSIGTVRLEIDGTPTKDPNGQPIATYTHDDIAGLAKVFTGMSWFASSPSESSWLSAPNAYTKPMIFYPKHHSTSEKRFLGTVIPASTTSNPAGDVKIALDTIFNHPNVGPFMARRLIQQFVTSNPSKEYIARIAGWFNDNGQGVRGDLATVLKKILLDDEARKDDDSRRAATPYDPNFGKLREPIIRVANWIRAFNATTHTATKGRYEVEDTSDVGVLAQAVLAAPSVFNFWRSTYVPPHTTLGQANLYAPEFQVVSELTTAAYINYMQNAITTGIGFIPNRYPSPADVFSNYTQEVALADNPDALLDRLNLLLFYGQMSATLRSQIKGAVGSVALTGTQTQIDKAKLNRAKLAIFLSMVSGEYLTQR